jgi:hypothetical protein
VVAVKADGRAEEKAAHQGKNTKGLCQYRQLQVKKSDGIWNNIYCTTRNPFQNTGKKGGTLPTKV